MFVRISRVRPDYDRTIAPLVNDQALVVAAQGGDRSSLDQLLRRHYDRVFGVCRRITANEADAADAAQEAMISIVRGLANFDGRSSFSTWVYRVATNASLDELRRRRRRPIAIIGPRDTDDTQLDIADPSSGSRIEALGDRLAIDAALLVLPEEFRVAVVLRDIGDLDYAEIALVLDVPIGTVKSRIARGRAILATQLGQSLRNQPDRVQRPTATS